MDSDRNLLFGVLAMLTDAVTRDQFIEACTAWSASKDRPLAELFVERGWMSHDDRANVEKLLERKLKKHAGDARAGLAEVAGDNVRHTIVEVADPDTRRTLATVAQMAAGPVHATTDFQPGSRGRYVRARLHAKGGIGQVWVARDDDLGRDVALKELREEHVDNSILLNRFLEEAKITGQLEHPNIVPVYELASAPGAGESPFYTMRFVRGRTLASAIKEYHRERQSDAAGGVALLELLNHFVAVCNAVAYAHSRGVLHRDLKPGNVVLGDYGEAMVLDWGLAKVKGASDPQGSLLPVALAGDSRHEGTLQGHVLGTPAYMPPEQAEGRLDLINERSDVYGLGAILYEILVGEPPFAGHDTLSVLNQVIADPPVAPRRMVPPTPPALEAICLKALAKNPASRYPSAKELAADVRRWMADEPVSAWPEPLRVRAGRWARRHRTLVAAAAVLLMSAVAGLSVGTFLLSQANARTKDQRDIAEANAGRAEKALAAEATARLRTRKALDEMSSQVIADWLSQKELKLDAAQEKFLNNAVADYRAFAAEAGDSEDVRSGAADAHLRVGEIYHKLARLADAEKANQEAIDAFAALAKDFPDRPGYPAKEATARANLATILWETGKLKESETAELESLALRQKLAKDFPDRPEFHQELGNSYRSLATLYAATRRTKDADDAFQKSLAELETIVKQFPAEKAYRSSLAAVKWSWGAELLDRSRFTEAETVYREAIALRRRLVEEAPDQPNYRLDLAHSCHSLSSALRATGRNKEAEEAVRESLRICKDLAANYPSIAGYRDSLADCYEELGILLAGTGRTSDAESPFRDSLAVRKQLASDFPTSVKFRVGLGYGLNNLGVFLYTTGRPKEAEAIYSENIELSRRLAEAYPVVTEYRERLGARLYNLALLLKSVDQREKAEVAYREAVGVFKKLIEERPNVLTHRRTLAKCLSGLSGVLQDGGHLDQAEAEAREAVSLNRGTVSENPKAPGDREELALSLDNLGLILASRNKLADAEAAYLEAARTYEKVAQEVPEEPHYGEELARCLVHTAKLQCDRKEYARAFPLVERARPLLDAALKANPKYDIYRANKRTLLATLASCQTGARKFDDATATAEGIAKLGWEPASDAYGSASAFAKCFVVVEGLTDLAPARRDELVKLFGGHAVTNLRLAVNKGFADVRHMKSDDDLRPLRNRQDYQDLVAEMEKKAGQGK
jgi:eukaryotic-like serine/threonine-protein kinase